MPPRSRNPEQGGGEQPRPQDRDIDYFVRTHGMTREEAAELVDVPLNWVQRLIDGDRDAVLLEAGTLIRRCEETYGPHQDWDEMRIIVGNTLVGLGHMAVGIEFLAQVRDIHTMGLRLVEFIVDGVRQGALSLQESMMVNILLEREFTRNGREQEYLDVGHGILTEYLANAGTSLMDVIQQNMPDIDAAYDKVDGAEDRTAELPESIEQLIENDALWPEGLGPEERRFITRHFFEHMIEMRGNDRKAVEEFKKCMKVQDAKHPAQIWNQFRFVAALGLYEADMPNFGRGVARSMSDETMIGMVCFALAEDGKDKEAFEVAEEITDAKLYGQVLHTAEWNDRSRVEELLTDMTVVTTHNRRKYDPARRLGVAEGLADLFAKRISEAEEAADENAATHWRTRLEEFESRAKLLRRQIELRYITAPAPVKKK